MRAHVQQLCVSGAVYIKQAFQPATAAHVSSAGFVRGGALACGECGHA